MDLNDPRRRLQVLNQTSPSLRVATAPQQPLRVQNNNAPRLFVGDQEVQNTTTNASNVQAPRQSDAAQVLSFLGDAAKDTAGFIPRFALNYAQAFGNLGTRAAGGKQQSTQEFYTDPITKTIAKEVGATGSGKQLAADAAQIGVAALTPAIGKAVTSVAAPVVAKAGGGLIANTIARGGAGALEGAIGGASQQAANEVAKGSDGKQIAEGAKTGAIFGAPLGALAENLSPLLGRLFKGKMGKLATNIAEETDPDRIAVGLGVDIDTARYLASESDPKIIKQVLKSVETDAKAGLEGIKGAQAGMPDNADLAEGVYTAYQPHPDSLPEGWRPPGTPDPTLAQVADVAEQAVPNPPAAAGTGVAKNVDEVIETIAKTSDEASVSQLVDEVLPTSTPEAKAAAAQALAKADSPEAVAEVLAQEISAKPVAPVVDDVAEAAAKVAPEPEAPAPTNLTQAVDQAPSQSGTADVVAPAGSTSNIGETVAESADQAVKQEQTASQAFPDASPEDQKAIQEVMDSLKSAEDGVTDVTKLRSKEKAARIAKGSGNFESAGGGEAGVRAKLSALKGKYSESAFEPITATPEAQTSILNKIEKSDLRDFEKLNLQNAMRKVWGATDGKPTTGDITSIRKFFGEDMADAIETAIKEDPKGWRDRIAQVAGTPRALMATGDLSFGLRQGAKLGARYPKEWATAQAESVKYAGSTKYFEEAMDNIRKSDYYEVMNDKMKVALTGANENMEEAFAGADIAEKIPVAGRAVSAADRAYSGAATKLRYDVTKNIIDKYGGIDNFVKNFSDKEMTDVGEVINTLTGRGGKAGGLTEKHMKTLSTTLFAPRLWAANLNLLNPQFYARLSPPARKIALESMGSFAGIAGSVLALAATAGADVGWDPRSADFAKIKVGNTRYDILGGLQQNIRLGAQLATGEKINSETGEKQTLGDGFTSPSRKDILLQAFENKENPLLAYATKLLEGKTPSGDPVNPITEGIKILTPLGAQGVVEATKDQGNLTDPKAWAKGVGLSAPGFFGVGAQTYGTTASKDKGKPDATGVPTFKGKITPDMVTDSAGKPILDEKGKPVKVKIPEGATELEKTALIDSKRKSALADQYKRSLSKEDQALTKLDGETRQRYLDDGTITQEQFDNLERFDKQVTNLDGQKIPKEAKSQAAKTFYEKFNSMTKKDQDYWLKEAPDDNAKSVATELNKTRAKGLSEFKPSNQLSKAYAEFEKDMNAHPEYTEVDKRNKTKAFQTFAYKLNYNDNAKDIYAEGGSDDLKTLMEQKSVSKEDLDEAIKMDNELFASGLTGTLKFTKKFRNTYGYAVPSGGTGSGSGGSGGSDTKRAYLSALMPSFSKSGSGGDAPQFSSVSRKPKFKSGVTPASNKGKKISYNP